MSVHSNHYESEEEYLRDLRSEYAREQYEMYHYDDDESEEDFCICVNCIHCKELKIYKRCGRYLAPEYTDEPEGKVVIYSNKRVYTDSLVCTNEDNRLYMTEVDEDDTCCNFEVE